MLEPGKNGGNWETAGFQIFFFKFKVSLAKTELKMNSISLNK